MSERNFRDLLENRWSRGNFVCVGLDSELDKIPQSVYVKNKNGVDIVKTIVAFNRAIVDETNDLVCAYKPNIAFYAPHGVEGTMALQQTIAYINAVAPDIPVVLDAKRGDIDNTNEGYVSEAFDLFQADAVTVHPYLGAEALQPFLERKEKGIIVLCRTSNPSAGEFQDLIVNGEPLYLHVARRVANEWNKNGNCALVVGATYPNELRGVRKVVGNMPILIPGIGAQGGNAGEMVIAGKDSNNCGMIVNASRSIIFASNEDDFAQVAREKTSELHTLINRYR